jgi:hypothetical protein
MRVWPCTVREWVGAAPATPPAPLKVKVVETPTLDDDIVRGERMGGRSSAWC